MPKFLLKYNATDVCYSFILFKPWLNRLAALSRCQPKTNLSSSNSCCAPIIAITDGRELEVAYIEEQKVQV